MDTKSGAELVKETYVTSLTGEFDGGCADRSCSEITAAAPAPVAATETKPDEPVAAPATKDEVS